MIKIGSDTHETDFNDNNCFLVACQNGCLAVAKYLINEAGFDIHEKNDIRLEYACNLNNNNDLVEYLIEAGLNLTEIQHCFSSACDDNNLALAKILIEAGYDIDQKCDIIADACENGYLDLIKYFVALGWDINEPDNNGGTNFMVACRSGNLDLVKYLPEEVGCDIYAKCDDEDGFMFACADGHLDIVKYLVEIGCTADENTATFAFDWKQYIVAMYLLEHGGEVLIYPDTNTEHLEIFQDMIQIRIQEIKSKHEVVDEFFIECDYLIVDLISQFSFGLKKLQNFIKKTTPNN